MPCRVTLSASGWLLRRLRSRSGLTLLPAGALPTHYLRNAFYPPLPAPPFLHSPINSRTPMLSLTRTPMLSLTRTPCTRSHTRSNASGSHHLWGALHSSRGHVSPFLPLLFLFAHTHAFPCTPAHSPTHSPTHSLTLAVMLAGAIIYGVRYTLPEYVCTLLVAGGVSMFALFKVGCFHFNTRASSCRFIARCH
ncbi:unnamed protein product [Closterium sp. NIES-53]